MIRCSFSDTQNSMRIGLVLFAIGNLSFRKDRGFGRHPNKHLKSKGGVPLLENRRVYGHRLCLLFSQNRIPGASPVKIPFTLQRTIFAKNLVADIKKALESAFPHACVAYFFLLFRDSRSLRQSGASNLRRAGRCNGPRRSPHSTLHS